MTVGAVMLLSGAIILPTSEKTLGIFFMTLFWVPYGLYWSMTRGRSLRSLSLKQPTAPVFTGPLPVAVVVVSDDEDPAPAA